MNTVNTVDNTAHARRVIDAYLYRARSKHEQDIKKACHIKPIEPFSAKEFVEWIKADKFKWKENCDPTEELVYYNDVLGYIVFRTEEPDYKKQKELNEKAEKDFLSIHFHNQVLEPEKVMKEAEEFAKKTYH